MEEARKVFKIESGPTIERAPNDPKRYYVKKTERVHHSYPFRKMGVGAEFSIPASEPDIVQRARAAGCHYGRRNGAEFASEKIGDVVVFRRVA